MLQHLDSPGTYARSNEAHGQITLASHRDVCSSHCSSPSTLMTEPPVTHLSNSGNLHNRHRDGEESVYWQEVERLVLWHRTTGRWLWTSGGNPQQIPLPSFITALCWQWSPSGSWENWNLPPTQSSKMLRMHFLQQLRKFNPLQEVCVCQFLIIVNVSEYNESHWKLPCTRKHTLPINKNETKRLHASAPGGTKAQETGSSVERTDKWYCIFTHVFIYHLIKWLLSAATVSHLQICFSSGKTALTTRPEAAYHRYVF